MDLATKKKSWLSRALRLLFPFAKQTQRSNSPENRSVNGTLLSAFRSQKSQPQESPTIRARRNGRIVASYAANCRLEMMSELLWSCSSLEADSNPEFAHDAR